MYRYLLHTHYDAIEQPFSGKILGLRTTQSITQTSGQDYLLHAWEHFQSPPISTVNNAYIRLIWEEGMVCSSKRFCKSLCLMYSPSCSCTSKNSGLSHSTDPGHLHSSLNLLQCKLVSLEQERTVPCPTWYPVTELNTCALLLLGATSIAKQENAPRAHLSQQQCLLFTSTRLSSPAFVKPTPGDLGWNLLIPPSRKAIASQMLQCLSTAMLKITSPSCPKTLISSLF